MRTVARRDSIRRFMEELAAEARGDGWEERSPFIAQLGRLAFHHFDLYGQALAKVERGHTQDVADVREMLRRGLVDPVRAREYFGRIELELYRYPAIDPPAFRRAVEQTFA